MAIRALLFDFDGLLLDTETPELVAWQEIWRDFGHELPVDEFERGIGTVGGFGAFDALNALAGPLDRDDVLARQSTRRLALIEAEEVRPGVAQYLRDARRHGLKTAIVSSSSRPWIDQHLARLGSASDFDAIVCSEGNRERGKPAPTLFLETLTVLGIEAREAVAFEDSAHGVRAAKTAGIYCVGVPSVTTAAALSEADVVVASLTELPLDALLDEMTK